jgi:hypothetical protein
MPLVASGDPVGCIARLVSSSEWPIPLLYRPRRQRREAPTGRRAVEHALLRAASREAVPRTAEVAAELGVALSELM